MKREYMKPTMRVVEIQQHHILCASPGGYGGQTLGTYRTGDDIITDGDEDTLF